MNISVVGISHHTAPVEAREALALPGSLAAELLGVLKADKVFQESLVLDTCNRTEIYFVADGDKHPLKRLLEHISRVKSTEPLADTSALYMHEGRAAVEHLLRVAASLDSQIVGEHQILGQVKDAYRLAVNERTAKFFLNKLLHSAFRVGKRGQTETELGSGATSVAQAAVDLSHHVFASLEDKCVLLVGAGQTGALAAKSLVGHGVGRVIVANRTVERACEVAWDVVHLRPEDADLLDLDQGRITCPALLQMLAELDGSAAGQTPAVQPLETQAIGLDAIGGVIDQVDMVICATGAPEVVLKAEELAPAIRQSGHSLFIVDIAVPRDVDPALGDLDNVFLYNIDDLDRIVDQNVQTRRREIPHVEAIIADELAQFVSWYGSLQVTPTIKLLRERFSRMREAEIKRYGSKFAETDQEQLDQFTRGLCNKILHQPIAFLRALPDAGGSSDRLAGVAMIRTIFELDELEGKS